MTKADPTTGSPAPDDDRRGEPVDEGAADAARRLLDREPPEAYLDAWTRALRHALGEEDASERFSAGIVRLGTELFALPTRLVVEVHPLAPIRSVPGRVGDVFRGLVSLRGEIHLCASLHALFGLTGSENGDAPGDEHKLLVVQQAGESWALIVDEVLDFERFDAADVQGAQVTVSKSAVHFTDGVVQTPAGPAARVDPERLLRGLERSLT